MNSEIEALDTQFSDQEGKPLDESSFIINASGDDNEPQSDKDVTSKEDVQSGHDQVSDISSESDETLSAGEFGNSESENKISNDSEVENNETEEDNEFKPQNTRIESREVKKTSKRTFAPPLRGSGRKEGRAPPGRVTLFQTPRNNRFSETRGNIPQKFKPDRSDDDSVGYVSNWGYRSNLIDQDGHFQRATTDLKNYIAFYRAKYYYYFDLVNGRYPQFVRKFQNNLEIWRMSFNVYASGFSDYIAHLGEIHAFYQMELVNNELRWVYKDFNFYPNKMPYGFRVNSFDIADVHSRFVKFICLRDSIIKQFPYVNIQHEIFIFRKFDENLRNMMNRLSQVKLADIDNFSENEDVFPLTTQGDRQMQRHVERQIEQGNVSNRKERNGEMFASFKSNYRQGHQMNRRVNYYRPRRDNFRN